MSLTRSLSHYCWRGKLWGPDAKKSGSPHSTCARPYTSPYVQGPTAYTSAHMYTCQVRLFSSLSPKIAQSRLRVCVYEFIWFHLVYILHLHIHPCLCARFPNSKSRNFIITTGCVSHRLSSLPVSPQSFVLMSFSYDIQTSSCLKPPDPFLLCVCHCKQQPSDSGGGAWFGPQIF